jgi:pyridoxal phosphate enzyme (YggS family)
VDPALLADRLARVRASIAAACGRSGREPDQVRVVAVTKGHPVETLLAALEAGLADIGENRVQEAQVKFRAAGDRLAAARRHLVGHLQRNKARDAIALFDLVHSVDSLRLAHELSARAAESAALFPVLVQVNASGEERKQGFAPDEAAERAHEIAALPNLRVRGFMTMAPWTDDEAVLRRTFGAARRLFDDARAALSLDTLSMGMSNDYPVAVEEGATMVRLGTVLFGERNVP